MKTAFLQAGMERDGPDVYVILLEAFEGREKQKSQVRRLKALLYALRLSPVVGGAQCTRTCWILVLPPAPLISVSTTSTPE